MRGSAGRAVVPALVVLALLAVVAIAATGSTRTGTDRTRPPGATLLDTIFSLGLLAVVAGGVLVAYGLLQRKEIAREVASGRYRRFSLLAWILFVAAFALLVYWRGWEIRPPQSPISDVVPTDATPPPSSAPENAGGSKYEPRLAWIPIAVVLGLVGAAAVAYVVAGRRARGRLSEQDALAEDVALVLDDTLDDLRSEPDPRRAIIAAYARLEQVLATNGVRRREAETEEEYLTRFLRSLAVSGIAARRLTDLFEWARFSRHTIDERMKEEAIGALEQLRDELRRAHEDRVSAAAGTPLAEAAS